MGALRAKNGHPEPYGVRFWQVANEITSADYEARLADFCRAMKGVDPTIKLMASFPTPGVVGNAGELLDYVCPHHYGCADLGGMAQDIEAIRGMIRGYAPGRDIKIGVTEWNTTAGDWGPGRAMLWTLENALACSRYHNLMHRHCDLVEIANRSNLTNSFCSGIVQTDRYRLYKTPTYYAQQLYATLGGTRSLRIESSVPVTVGADISATLSARGDRLTLFAVNDSPEALTRIIDLSAVGKVGPSLEVWTLADRDAAGEPDVTNSFADPTRVTARRSTRRLDTPRFEYRFPALSLTAIVCPVRGA
jgi:alpha-N-arabinofuranosidase